MHECCHSHFVCVKALDHALFKASVHAYMTAELLAVVEKDVSMCMLFSKSASIVVAW